MVLVPSFLPNLWRPIERFKDKSAHTIALLLAILVQTDTQIAILVGRGPLQLSLASDL
jgi:hypothetical protein